MIILALESSARPASVAVCSDGELIGQYFQNNGLTHSRTLLAMAESLLVNLELSIADIGLIAVSSGPGSFTGVRIGVSAAKGLAWGLDIPVCGVSTLEAMAYQAAGAEPSLICPVMDARRDQVYNALFEAGGAPYSAGGNAGVETVGVHPVRLCEDRAISLEDLANDLKSYGAQCLLVGDGSAISHASLEASGINCQIAPGLLRWQTAYGVALAAATKTPIPAAQLEPSYLRPSQAERERHTTEKSTVDNA